MSQNESRIDIKLPWVGMAILVRINGKYVQDLFIFVDSLYRAAN